MGTGKEVKAVQKLVAPGGVVMGVDLSSRMAQVTHHRTQAGIARADARRLPFADRHFDRLFCAYMLDLIPRPELQGILGEFHRVLKPGGKAAVITMTEGVNLPSRAFVAVWKAAYAISPFTCGGCRPLQLKEVALRAGFDLVECEVAGAAHRAQRGAARRSLR